MLARWLFYVLLLESKRKTGGREREKVRMRGIDESEAYCKYMLTLESWCLPVLRWGVLCVMTLPNR